MHDPSSDEYTFLSLFFSHACLVGGRTLWLVHMCTGLLFQILSYDLCGSYHIQFQIVKIIFDSGSTGEILSVAVNEVTLLKWFNKGALESR